MKLSIVTISFNQVRFLAECLDSVLAQCEPDLEYIVVDPGSTDGSRDLVARYGGRIDRVLLEPDSGPGQGLNRGFAAATGDVFAYINADDRLAPGACRYALRFFESHPEVDVLTGAIRIIDERGNASARKRTADPFDPVRYAAGICTVGQQGTFFRRGAFERAGGFNEMNRCCWDGELLVDLALAGARFATVHRVLGDFRVYPASISGAADWHARAVAEHNRIGRKIVAHGARLMSPDRIAWSRLAYRFNPMRHLGYFLVR